MEMMENRGFKYHYVFDLDCGWRFEFKDNKVVEVEKYHIGLKGWLKHEVGHFPLETDENIMTAALFKADYLKSQPHFIQAVMEDTLGIPLSFEIVKLISVNKNRGIRLHEWMTSKALLSEHIGKYENLIFKLERMENYSLNMGYLAKSIMKQLKALDKIMCLPDFRHHCFNSYPTNHVFLGGEDSVSFGPHTDPYPTVMVPAYSDREILKITQIFYEEDMLEIPMSLNTMITVMPGVIHNNLYLANSAMHSFSFEKHFDESFL